MTECLERAWEKRAKEGWLERLGALRVFHGPGEGEGPWKDLAIERFVSGGEAHFWVTSWGSSWKSLVAECAGFLDQRSARSAVVVERPEKGVAEEAKAFLGEPPESIWVDEGPARFQIRFRSTRHPGLFLDHEPLRSWLLENARGWKVLNTFAYTGSLSVAAALGKATQVTTLDLSKPSLDWAKENWKGNSLSEENAKFIFGDVFEWLPRLKRGGSLFDCVILDPPSFSRGKKSSFSTAKDLPKLHRIALDLLASGGSLVTSINSANVSVQDFQADIEEAARLAGRKLTLVRKIQLPETFSRDNYLKGGIYVVN